MADVGERDVTPINSPILSMYEYIFSDDEKDILSESEPELFTRTNDNSVDDNISDSGTDSMPELCVEVDDGTDSMPELCVEVDDDTDSMPEILFDQIPYNLNFGQSVPEQIELDLFDNSTFRTPIRRQAHTNRSNKVKTDGLNWWGDWEESLIYSIQVIKGGDTPEEFYERERQMESDNQASYQWF